MPTAETPESARSPDALRAWAARDPLFVVAFAALALGSWSAVFRSGFLPGAGSRLVLALYAIALPASATIFAERFGRSRWLAVFTFPLAWNAAIERGPLAFAAALPVMLLAIAALDRALEAPSVPRLAGAAALALLTACCHLVPFALYVPAAGLVIAARSREAGARATRGAAVALAVAAIGAALHLRLAEPARWDAIGAALAAGPDAPLEALREIYHRVLINVPGRADDYALMAIALAWLLTTTFAAERASGGETAPLRLRDFVPEAAFFLAALGYFVVPKSLDLPGDPRLGLLPIASLFGAVLARGPLDGWRRALLLPAIAAALVYPHLLVGIEAAP